MAIAESSAERKDRGAFFTPPAISNFLTRWAIDANPAATVLDPTCGDGSFLVAGAKHLRAAGAEQANLADQLVGIDIDEDSLLIAQRVLATSGGDASLLRRDFFDVPAPDSLLPEMGPFDAVVGNPPFVRYQRHSGDVRRRSIEAAFRGGVRLSGLASSWASALVHAASFLKAEGRLGMVLPAELLTVGYAEPIRRWLRSRFENVRLVVVESHEFSDAQEKVLLLLADGSGGCEGFSIYHVQDASELEAMAFTEAAVVPALTGKWTELFLRTSQRRVFRSVLSAGFAPLSSYGTVGLGTVTGANDFFAIDDVTRLKWAIPDADLVPIHPPGTKVLKGVRFTRANWHQLRQTGERVWLLHPSGDPVDGTRNYIDWGESAGINTRYKCRSREPWWRPPLAAEPHFFFTYMSHQFPRLVANTARVRILNSMHGVALRQPHTHEIESLPILAMNSLTLLGAELFGRSYGGGILKMEPTEAAVLPIPNEAAIEIAWGSLRRRASVLHTQMRRGQWSSVVAEVDDVLLSRTLAIAEADVMAVQDAVKSMRRRRLSRPND